jgi:hypothetical protein
VWAASSKTNNNKRGRVPALNSSAKLPAQTVQGKIEVPPVFVFLFFDII